MYNEETWKQELLQEGPYREAKAWLAEGVGTLGKTTRRKVRGS